jgi:hypothetical protein
MLSKLRLRPMICSDFTTTRCAARLNRMAGLGQILGDIASDVPGILKSLPGSMEDASVDKLCPAPGATLQARIRHGSFRAGTAPG